MARSSSQKSKPAASSPPPPPPGRKASVIDDPPRKNVLLLTCMDQRLLDETVEYMNRLNLTNRYDQVSLAGGPMGAHRLNPPSSVWQPVFFDHLKAAIDLLHRPIKDVFLFEHLDCGAYKYLYPDPQVQQEYEEADLAQMEARHRQELCEFAAVVTRFIHAQQVAAEAEYEATRQACAAGEEGEEGEACWERVRELAEEKAKAWSDIRVSYFLVDLIGGVKQLDLSDDQTASF